LRLVEIDIPTIWKSEAARLYAGTAPTPSGGLQSVVVREGRVAVIEPRDLSFKSWSDRKYYELCTAPAVYEMVERERAGTMAAR